MPDIKALLHLASNILHFFFAVANAVMYEGETFVASFVDIITKRYMVALHSVQK